MQGYYGSSPKYGICLHYIRPASIDEALQNYYRDPDKYAPPVVRVKFPDPQMHFAVIYGGTKGAYISYDPGNKDHIVTWNIDNSPTIIQFYK